MEINHGNMQRTKATKKVIELKRFRPENFGFDRLERAVNGEAFNLKL